MIRKYENKDLDAIMNLWLKTNIEAHSFIKASYWEGMYDTVKSMLPEADIYVYEEDREIIGFIGVFDANIAGIFIKKNHQSKGIGKALLDFIKEENETLSLQVYQKNKQAQKFYQREGFKLIKQGEDEQTSEQELHLEWSK